MGVPEVRPSEGRGARSRIRALGSIRSAILARFFKTNGFRFAQGGVLAGLLSCSAF